MAVRVAHTKSMDEATHLGKNRRIAKSQKETRERRKNKDILVRTVRRNDAANKVASWVLGYEHVFMQDENISS